MLFKEFSIKLIKNYPRRTNKATAYIVRLLKKLVKLLLTTKL